MLLLNIISIVLLLGVAHQDFRYRAVSWILFVSLFFVFLSTAILAHGVLTTFHFFIYNATFVIIQLIFLSLYFSIKNKRITNIVNTYLGVGDIVLMIVLCLVFSLPFFILFFISSIFITLLGFGIYFLIKKRTEEIPLAGTISILLVSCLLIKMINPAFDFYNETIIFTWFKN